MKIDESQEKCHWAPSTCLNGKEGHRCEFHEGPRNVTGFVSIVHSGHQQHADDDRGCAMSNQERNWTRVRVAQGSGAPNISKNDVLPQYKIKVLQLRCFAQGVSGS